MDKATYIGYGLGFSIIFTVMCMGHGGHVDIKNFKLFCDPEAAIVTFGGALTAMMIAFPLAKFMNFGKVSMIAFKEKGEDPVMLVKEIVELATIARRDGILVLEDRLPNVKDPFLRQGLQLLVDGTASDVVQHMISQDIELLEKRHEVGHKMWEKLAYLGPAIGMVGTLIGLVKMLANLNDPSKIGGGMAVALLTTFYGALLANFFAIPMECKLAQKTKEEIHHKEMILAALLGIQSGDSPRIVMDKLKLYLKPAERAKLEEK